MIKWSSILLFLTMSFGIMAVSAQPLSLDSCRRLALRNNKVLAVSRVKQEKSYNDRKVARTNYLPKLSVAAAYVRSGNEISLLNDRQKGALGNLGTNIAGEFGELAGHIVQKYPDLAPLMQQFGGHFPQVSNALNGLGQQIADAFRTDTRNMTLGAVLLTQPLYMGGKIRAYDRITRYSEYIAGEQLRADEQQVVLDTDQAYWQVVSLVGKHRLAMSYLDMLRRLDSDVTKMIAEGLATKANGLTVSVKMNEAEISLTKVENGLALSRMLLCQLCGLPLNTPLLLADEAAEDLPLLVEDVETSAESAFSNRPELLQLATAIDIYREKVNIEKAAFLPQLSLSGSFLATNPGLTNGFEKRFRGMWAVGLVFKMPVWNWGEGKYKVRAAKAEAKIAEYKAEEAREKVELQVAQSAFRVNEANKQYAVSRRNLEKAEENLRTAKIGFDEGVIPMSDLLSAQTAWVQAQSGVIDARIDIRLTRAVHQKALGINASGL